MTVPLAERGWLRLGWLLLLLILLAYPLRYLQQIAFGQVAVVQLGSFPDRHSKVRSVHLRAEEAHIDEAITGGL